MKWCLILSKYRSMAIKRLNSKKEFSIPNKIAISSWHLSCSFAKNSSKSMIMSTFKTSPETLEKAFTSIATILSTFMKVLKISTFNLLIPQIICSKIITAVATLTICMSINSRELPISKIKSKATLKNLLQLTKNILPKKQT